MNLNDKLKTECIQVGSSARTKTEVLREIASLAKKCPVLAGISEEGILSAFREREEIGSTALGRGIAIPHCGMTEVEDFVVGILLIPEGVDFDAPDGETTRVFFFIIGPKTERNRHIQILSAISRLLKTPKIVEKLLKSEDAESIRNQLSELIEIRSGDAEEKGNKCLFHVFVQREDFFDDILQELSAVVHGSLAVLETDNAGHYLHTLPLFSTYWTDEKKTFFRIILALVNRDACNDVIRRINMITNTLGDRPGVLIAVQELLYASGSVEF